MAARQGHRGDAPLAAVAGSSVSAVYIKLDPSGFCLTVTQPFKLVARDDPQTGSGANVVWGTAASPRTFAA